MRVFILQRLLLILQARCGSISETKKHEISNLYHSQSRLAKQLGKLLHSNQGHLSMNHLQEAIYSKQGGKEGGERLISA